LSDRKKAPRAEVIARLKAAGVAALVDVRAVAGSRRAGFSRTIPGTGPQGSYAERRAIFQDHLAEPAAQSPLAELQALASEAPVALPCEADRAGRHRAVLADRLATRDGFDILNL
jgi:hypothetical protein